MIQEINLQGSEEGRVGQREKLTCNEVVPEASADPAECSRDGMGLHIVTNRGNGPEPYTPLIFPRGC